MNQLFNSLIIWMHRPEIVIQRPGSRTVCLGMLVGVERASSQGLHRMGTRRPRLEAELRQSTKLDLDIHVHDTIRSDVSMPWCCMGALTARRRVRGETALAQRAKCGRESHPSTVSPQSDSAEPQCYTFPYPLNKAICMTVREPSAARCKCVWVCLIALVLCTSKRTCTPKRTKSTYFFDVWIH